MESPIPGTRATSAVEHRLREFLKGKSRVGTSLSLTLARFAQWTASMEPAPVVSGRTLDPVEQIAESLIEGATDTERQLLSKSLQETLLSCVGFAVGVPYPEVGRRIKQYIAGHGVDAILQRFLALHFFNFAWFHTGDSFRALARTSAAFEKDMQTVEALCQKAVLDIWRPSDLSNVTAARLLVRAIEERLRMGESRG